jgi:putative transposase
MKASRFSDAQKASILKLGADAVPGADICRRDGISKALYPLGSASVYLTYI